MTPDTIGAVCVLLAVWGVCALITGATFGLAALGHPAVVQDAPEVDPMAVPDAFRAELEAEQRDLELWDMEVSG